LFWGGLVRQTAVFVLLLLGFVTPTAAQVAVPKGASAEARRANEHYRHGWEAMRKEAWDEAAAAFQAAIDNDKRFALAYYSLGRAQMGRRDFSKAIAAYIACRESYLHSSGERFSNQMDNRRAIEDRILEYQTTISQAQQAPTGKSGTQSQALYLRELQASLRTLEQARDRSINVTMDATVPYFVPMALGAAYFRSSQFADAEREYKVALAANAASGETHSNLAVLYLVTNRLDQAEQEVKLAEKSGYQVNPGLKDEIKNKKSGR
jgi:tetratricopeptide (TPR) repeat protein